MVTKDIHVTADYEKLKDLVYREGLQAVVNMYKERYPELDLNFITAWWVCYRQFPCVIEGNKKNVVIRWSNNNN